MAETLLAILLVTATAKGTNLVFQWPAFPSSQPRLARPKPPQGEACSQIDHVWLSATGINAPSAGAGDGEHNGRHSTASLALPPNSVLEEEEFIDDWDYEWKRPNTVRERARATSFGGDASSGRSRPGSRRASPFKDAAAARSYSADADLRMGGGGGRSSSSSATEREYDEVLAYPVGFLADILRPKDDACHQKFELIVDDLAFVGHPVCAEPDGSWRFKADAAQKAGAPPSVRRGRGGERGAAESVPEPSLDTRDGDNAEAEGGDSQTTPTSSSASAQQMFHLVFVLDLPDPSSSASGNLFKYFHIIYESIAFTVTAVLYQEQVLHRFIDTECEALSSLRESCFKRGEPFSSYVAQALDNSNLARVMKTLFDAIKANTIARLLINEIRIEVQLPPQLDNLLHSEEDNPDYVEHEDPESVSWGQELSFGWGLPALAPWKSLLLFNVEDQYNDLKTNLSHPGLSQEDQMLAEGLIQFLETVSIFDSLAVVAHSLDWDLERQVYPTVRWLVYHRKAKVVDTVHRGLRTVFALPSKMERTIPELTSEFTTAFPSPVVPPLPKLFSAISNPHSQASSTPFSPSLSIPHSRELQASGERDITALSQSENNNFFATVVRNKDLIPVFQDVVVWLLRRDLLVTLHLRIRIVATPEIKETVRKRREAAARRRFMAAADPERGRERGRGVEKRRTSGEEWRPLGESKKSNSGSGGSRRRNLVRPTSGSHLHEPAITFEDERERERERETDSFVLRSRRRRRRFSSKSVGGQGSLVTPAIPEEGRFEETLERAESDADDDDDEEEEEEEESDDDGHGNEWDMMDDNHLPSIIPEPGSATPLQRKWIEAMSDGKTDEIARRFKQINQYFDGKRTDDEILYRAEINRKQLREVLRNYEEYILTFLHPA